LVEVTTFPPAPTATHSETDGHEMLVLALPTFVVVQAADPPVGLVEVTTFPPPSTATHNAVDGQETLLSDSGIH
jgi:hypothetical protein